ncbi:hypothetical protein QF047_002269 [Arthrobacter sp. W4I7]|nr:hypothetical protein [Arthrobacter sp. W4I7]
MFTPGPRSTSTPSARASIPSAAPMLESSSRSHELAEAEAVGNAVEGSAALIPR